MDGYIYDYRLGYIRSGCPFEGFSVIGDDDAAQGRIVTLGGYTTPEIAQSGRSWADSLHKQTQGKYQILNGCTDGYSSAQILTMLIRDVILIKPKVVVLLSGFYNIAYKHGFIQDKADASLLSMHPFATPGSLHFYRKITSRLGLGNDEVYYGEENNLPAWKLWLKQMAEIECLCNEFEIEFKSFLQPCVFSGNYKRSERENEFLLEHYRITEEEIGKFQDLFQYEYARIIEQLCGIDYVTDISQVFDGHNDVYEDAYHVRDEYLPALTEAMGL